MKKILPVGICLILMFGCQESPRKALSSEALIIESTILKQKELFEVPGLAVGIIKNDTIIYADAHGVQGLDTWDTLTTKSLFHMASVSKPFVATALVQLMEKGEIDLDEKLTHYLPYFTMADDRYKAITIRQMLTHTSGIPDVEDYEWDKPEYDDGAAERYAKSFDSITLDFAPGERFSYSNAAFDVLCDVIAKVSGMTFEEYIKRNIFEPVGMKNSTFFRPEIDQALATSPHIFGDSLQKEVSKIYPYNRRHAGSSTLHSNVEDMLLWATVYLNKGTISGKRIFSEASYEIITTVQTGENQRKIGLSWFLGTLNESKLIYHSGGDTGYSTFFGFMPEEKAAIAMMANTDYYWSMSNSGMLLKNTVFEDSLTAIAPIHFKLKNYILTDGIEKMKAVYFEEQQRMPPNYEFDSGYLDDLGYWLLDVNQSKKALDVFLFQTELEPEHAGWVDSVADAYRAMDSTALAIRWYRKALDMKPDQDFSQKKLNELLDETDE